MICFTDALHNVDEKISDMWYNYPWVVVPTEIEFYS